MSGVEPIPVVAMSRPDLLRSPQRKGFRRRWARDTEEDVERLKEMGYEPVKQEEGDKKGEVVRRRDMVLMEVPEELYRAREREKVRRQKERRQSRSVQARAVQETDDLVTKMGRDRVKRLGGIEVTGGGD